MLKFSVNLVTWNGGKYIPYLFDSLRKQSFKGWELLVIDNNSTDNTLELIKKELNNFPIQYRIIANKENRGFAGGHNQGFAQTNSDYVLLLNQDMYLMPDCLEKVAKFLDHHSEAAAVSPRLMKWDFNLAATGLQNSFTEQIDTLGLKIYRNRRVVEQYAQQNWQEVKNQMTQEALSVFGVSGALPVFRRSALKELAYADGSIFDESYHSYKEDVDLAYRLTSAGYKSYVLLEAVAYHDRSAAGPKELSDASALHNKQKQSEWIKFHSYKNHLMTLYKNEYWQNFIFDLPWIFFYELKKFIYFLIFDFKVINGLRELKISNLTAKRQWIKKLHRISWWQMGQWWN